LHIVKDTCNWIVELTGTPGSNGLIDLWGQMYFLDKGARLGKSFTAFTDRWFDKIDCGGYFTKLTPKEIAAKEIAEKVKDICLTVRAEDYFDIEKVIDVKIEVELPPSVRKIYDKFEKELFAELENCKDIRAFNAGGKTMKCLQIASGAVYTDEDEWSILHTEKLDAIESIIEEAAGEPVIIAYHWKHDIIQLKKRFPQIKMFKETRDVISKWNAGDIQLLGAHPESMGHGLNLQDGGRRIIFMSHWWAPEPKRQIIERIGPLRQMQSGHKRSVFKYDVIARNTLDERVILAHANKLSIDQALKCATRR
jgi:SNF2 family DNA or RNA helicase